MPLSLHGFVSDRLVQVSPVPGTMVPMYEGARMDPVNGFTARRPACVFTGANNTGGFPPHLGSNRCMLKIDATPSDCSGQPTLYTRSPTSSVRLREIFQVSCAKTAMVRRRELSGPR